MLPLAKFREVFSRSVQADLSLRKNPKVPSGLSIGPWACEGVPVGEKREKWLPAPIRDLNIPSKFRLSEALIRGRKNSQPGYLANSAIDSNHLASDVGGFFGREESN